MLRRMKRNALLATGIALGLFAGCANTQTAATAPAVTPDATAAKITAALAGAHRSEKNSARDQYRHPAQTLAFFGLKDNMTVLELSPGGGWYTEVLAPVMRESGKLKVTSSDPSGDPEKYGVKRAKELQELKAAHPDVFDKLELQIVSDDVVEGFTLGEPNSVDLAVSFRSLHGWADGEAATHMLKAVFNVLKPGGTFGLVDHRANVGGELKGGYIPEAMAIELCEKAGLKLVEKSEVNANPKDTKDYEKGVWALPPSLSNGDTDRDKYVAIGESDRFTLKFVKP